MKDNIFVEGIETNNLKDIDVEIVNANDPANIDRAREYQIMAVPTVVIDGNVEFIGAPSDVELINKLESLL